MRKCIFPVIFVITVWTNLTYKREYLKVNNIYIVIGVNRRLMKSVFYTFLSFKIILLPLKFLFTEKNKITLSYIYLFILHF